MMNKFIRNEKYLPKKYRYVEEYYQLPDGETFLKKYKKRLKRDNITEIDLIQRQYLRKHSDIEKFRKEYLPFKKNDQETLKFFSFALSFYGHPSFKEIDEKFDLYLELMNESNLDFFKQMVEGEFVDMGFNCCIQNLLRHSLYYGGDLGYDHLSNNADFLPYRYRGMMAFLYFHKNKRLYEKGFHLCLELIKKIPEQSFVLLASLWKFCESFDKKHFSELLNFVRTSPNVISFLKSVYGKPLKEVPIYGAYFNSTCNFQNVSVNSLISYFYLYDNFKEEIDEEWKKCKEAMAKLI